MEMRKLMNFMHRSIEAGRPTDDQRHYVTKMQGMVVGYLARHEHEEVFQKDIETHFSMRRSTTSTMLKSMEEKGLIKRISIEQDARVKKLQLSEKGKSMVEEVTLELQKIDELLTEGISEEELNQFFEIIYKMQQNMLKNKEI